MDSVAGYVVPMLEWAQEMIAEALGTHKMPVPKSMEAPHMKCVGESTGLLLLPALIFSPPQFQLVIIGSLGVSLLSV